MTASTKTRSQHSKPKKPCCVICGSPADIELHHIGGRNHAPTDTVPLCRTHHLRLTEKIRVAGVDMPYTSDKRLRLVRAQMAAIVFIWNLLEEMLQELEREESEK